MQTCITKLFLKLYLLCVGFEMHKYCFISPSKILKSTLMEQIRPSQIHFSSVLFFMQQFGDVYVSVNMFHEICSVLLFDNVVLTYYNYW